MPQKTHKVTVEVAKREGDANGWFHAGRHFTEGTHEDVELTESQIQGLARRPGVIVMLDGKRVKPSEEGTGSATAATEELTSDELEALRKYRADRAAAAKAEEQASSGGGLEFDSSAKPSQPAGSPTKSGGAPVAGASADTPLQHSDILHGNPPKSGDKSKGK